MSKRIGILVMFAFCGALALVWGQVAAQSARGVILDYRVMDLGARCLLQHGDPYNEADMLRVYQSENQTGGVSGPGKSRFLATTQVYPPTAELVFAPFALLPWSEAYRVWIAVTFGFLLLATFLMWDIAQNYASDPPFFLACIVLANSGILFSGGNPAGIAVSLCVISFWCFYRERFEWAGVACLAISLAIKPHDAGLVWLFLLMLGGAFRKQALRVLAVTAVIGAAALAWIFQVAPNWVEELRANLTALSGAGSYNDPATATPGLIVNLQTVTAAFRNDPRFYNAVTYLVCAPLLVWWLYVTLRGRHSSRRLWLGTAAISALSLLPVYHRPYDAKILLLSLPACAALWAEGGMVAWLAFAFTGAGILITSDIPVAALSMIGAHSYSQPGIWNKIKLLSFTRPAPLILLGMAVFYLWAYAGLLPFKGAGLPVADPQSEAPSMK